MKRLLLFVLLTVSIIYISSCGYVCKKTFQCFGNLSFITVGFDSADLDSMRFISYSGGVSDTRTISSLNGYPSLYFYGDTCGLNLAAVSGNQYTIIFPTIARTYSITLTATNSSATTSYKCEEGSAYVTSTCPNTLTSYTINGQTYTASPHSAYGYTYFIVK